MGAETGHPISTKVYTNTDGRVVIEQPEGSVVLFSACMCATTTALHGKSRARR
jgi:hypothetical protein